MAAVTIHSDLGAQENKVSHYLHCFPIYLLWSDGTRCHDLSFLLLNFKPAFSLSSFTLIKRFFSYSSFSAIRVVSPAYLRLIFLLAVLIPALLHPSWHFAWCTLYRVKLAGWQYTTLTYPFPNLEPVHCSMSGSNDCFLTCTQISQEAGLVFLSL